MKGLARINAESPNNSIFLIAAIVVIILAVGTLLFVCFCKCFGSKSNINTMTPSNYITTLTPYNNVTTLKPSAPCVQVQRHIVNSRTYESVSNHKYELPVIDQLYATARPVVPRSNTDSTWNQTEDDDAHTIPFSLNNVRPVLTMFEELKLKQPIIN